MGVNLLTGDLRKRKNTKKLATSRKQDFIIFPSLLKRNLAT